MFLNVWTLENGNEILVQKQSRNQLTDKKGKEIPHGFIFEKLQEILGIFDKFVGRKIETDT